MTSNRVATQAINAMADEGRRILEEERKRSREFEKLVASGEIEAAKIIPPGVRGCRCETCGADPGDGYGVLVGWACFNGQECPFGRPEPGITLAEALGMRTEAVPQYGPSVTPE